MKANHKRCMTNFLIGFGSVLNIAPISSTTALPKFDTNVSAQPLRDAWQNVGKHLYNAMEQGKANA